MVRGWKLTLVAVLAVLGVAGIALAQDRMRLSREDWVRVMSQRQVFINCEGFAEAPSADASLMTCRMDRNARLIGLELSVGRRFGSGGNTSLYVQVNGTTVPSSTISVASDTAGTLRGFNSVVLDRNLVAGDLVHVRIGAVTTGANSRQLRGRAIVVERF